MNQRIEFWKQDLTPDENNEPVPGPESLVKKRWASVEYLSGNETEEAGRDNLVNKVTFRIRYTNSADLINANLWIKWRGKNYDIRDIQDPAGDKMFLVFRTEGRQDTT